MKYKYIQDVITSDVMFEAYGKTPKEVFENSALAMFETICIVDKVEPKKTIKIKIKGENLKDLLYNWLEELIGRVDTEEMFFSKFNITKIEDKELEAEISGESTSHEKAETLVKAVTYFGFDLKKSAKGYTATVSLDI